VAWAAVAAVVGDLLIVVGEDLGQSAALSRLLLVAMTPLQALELCLVRR